MAKQPQNSGKMFGGKSFKDLLVSSTKRGDLFFALTIIIMLVILIMPMPAWSLRKTIPERIRYQHLGVANRCNMEHSREQHLHL